MDDVNWIIDEVFRAILDRISDIEDETERQYGWQEEASQTRYIYNEIEELRRSFTLKES